MKNIKLAKCLVKIAAALIAVDFDYIYDPEHKKHPSGGYQKTEKGWTKNKSKEQQSDTSTEVSESAEQKQAIANSLFSSEEMNAPKVRNNVTTQEEFFKQAEQTQGMMMSMLDSGKEEQWLGKNARHISNFADLGEELKKPGPIFVSAPVKSAARAKEKVDTDYNGDWGQLKDGVRCSVAVDSFEELPKVIESFKSTGCKIVGPPKNRLAKRLESGYGDILCNVDFGNGFIGEVQFHLKGMLHAKEFGGGHKLYEAERSLREKCGDDLSKLSDDDKKQLDTQIALQKKLYNEAFEKTKVRMASMKNIIVSADDKTISLKFLSDRKYTFYLYGEEEFPAYCNGYNQNPRYWNGRKWVEVKSFILFFDNAVKITPNEFKKVAVKSGIVLK